MTLARLVFSFVLFLLSGAALSQGFPTPQEGTWVVRDFRFHTGEMLPELKLHYRTVGSPKGEPVIVLHGTTGSGQGMPSPAFGGELFGPGQPLDASRYYIILPDSIGHGKSSKPSDGLRAKFPRYNYDDMVDAQHRLVTEHLLRPAAIVDPLGQPFEYAVLPGGYKISFAPGGSDGHPIQLINAPPV